MKSLDGRSFGGTLPEWPIIWVLSGTDRVGWWVGCALWVSTFSRKLSSRL